MKKLYIIFEQIHSLKTGGLIATYVRLAPILKKMYDVHIVSIYHSANHDKLFDGYPIETLSNKNIDFSFPTLLQDLKHFHLGLFFHKLYDACYYFLSMPFLRLKMKKVLGNKNLVLVTSPVAAAFMPKYVPFLLEIHIYYEYFFGKNLLGRLQAKMMRKPSLTLFRTKSDAIKASNYMNANYIYNFLDNKEIVPRKKLIIGKICFVGRLDEQKNPLRLLDLARILEKKYPDFILDIYGTGSLYNEMQTKIKEYHLEKKVFLKGFINDKNLYANYTCLWMTSRYEGLSLTMIEAKANGIPIFSTPCGDGLEEVIHHGVDGYIFDNNEQYVDQTIALFKNPNLLKEISSNSLKDFERFSKSTAALNWKKILHQFEKDFL